MCSSRFIQITVIILVLVMAFCLVSITTLYILEKKDTKGPTVVLQPTSGWNATDNETEWADGSTTPNFDTFVPSTPLPLTPPRCLREKCAIVCCPDDGPPLNDPGLDTRTKTQKPDDPNNNHNRVGDKNTDSDYNHHYGYEYDMDGNPIITDAIYSSHNPPHPDVASTVITKSNKTPKKPQPRPVVMDGFKQLIAEEPNDVIAYRRKRATITSKMVPLVIKQLNTTLDTKYCANRGCRSGTGGRYDYSVPVSHMFPMAFITIHFQLPDEARVTLCKQPTTDYYQQYTCTPADGGHLGVVAAMQSGINEWDLPVGFYTAPTKYKLRVAATANTDVCHLADHLLGVTYTEYTIEFYRATSEACGQQESGPIT